MSESDNLKSLFKDIKNRKAFAIEHSLAGGDALVYQHMTGMRPISLDAAVRYAVAFDVPLAAISQRLADLIDKLPKQNDQTMATYQATEPPASQQYSAKVMPFSPPDDPDIAEVIRMMHAADSRGRAMALAAVRVALNSGEPSVKNAVQ